MSLKLVIPRDPLIFRDGKPFTAVPGERSKSLPFPYPATLAGAIRTRVGTKSDGEFDKSQIADLIKISMCGPVLVELDVDGKIKLDDRKDIVCFFPAPADALLVTEGGVTKRYSLAPLQDTKDRFSNIHEKLKLIGAKQHCKAKPTSNPPLFWSWNLIQQWLHNPPEEETIDLSTFDAIHGPARETRTHVSIDSTTQTALSGALFQTSGMEFIKKDETLSGSRQLALAIETPAQLANGVDFLGGERRMIRWESSDELLPPCPPEIKKRIIEDGYCRLLLATPAYFKEGYLSTEFEKKYNVEIQAVALPRYQTISGWDYDKRAPKETRRLVPAGSVYFIKFKDEKVIESFINRFWLNSICDEEGQDSRDGFGIALLGTWNGELRTMKFGGEE